jgi:O-antigen/teichoic acid export membrane protein
MTGYMNHDKHKPLSRVIFQYSSSRFFRLVFGAVSALIRPKLLSPEQFGIWKLFEIIPLYSTYLHLGTRDAMRFFIPFYSSRNDDHKTEIIKGTVFTSSLAINLLLSLFLFILGFQSTFAIEVRAGFFFMSLIIILLFLVDYYIALLRAYENFTLIAYSTYLNAASLFVFTIPLLYFFKLYGLYMTIFSTYLVTVIFLKLRGSYFIHYRIDFSVLKELFSKGAPVMISDFTIQLITTSDRFIVSGLIGSKELGYYGIAILAMTFLIQIPGTTREIMEPRLMRIVNNMSSETIANDFLIKPIVNTAYLMPFIIGPVFVLTPVLVPWLLPRYANGVVPAQILSMGVYFLSLAYVPRSVIVANNLQLKVAAFLPFILILNVIISVLLVKKGYGLSGVAIGSGIGFLFLFISLFIFSVRNIEYKFDDFRSHIFAICLPFPLMCLLLTLLYLIIPVFITNTILCAFWIILFFLIAMYFVHRLACRKVPLLKAIEIL